MLWHKVIGAGAGGGVPDSVVNTDFASALSVGTYTITDANLGTPAANRYIAVIAQDFNTSGTELSSITVGGQSTTFQSTGAIGTLPAAIGLISYPTGSTADITVDFGTTIVRGIIGVYAVYGITSLHDYNTNGSNGATTTGNQSYSLNEGDIVLATIYVTNGVGLTASGVTQDDVAIISGRYLSANSYGPSPTTQTFNYSWSWTNSTSMRWHSYVLR